MTDQPAPTGFPHYQGFWIFRRKAGWEDLGEKGTWKDDKCGFGEKWYTAHIFCQTQVHIGRDADGSLFTFCPRCLVKTDSTSKDD